jgi:hypothetical protein
MDYLVFLTESAAQTAAEDIYAKMVAVIESPDLLDVTTGQVIPQAHLTEDERTQYEVANRRFPIFGINAASLVKNTENGFTTSWATPRQRIDGRWVFPSPGAAILSGLSVESVEPFDPAWFPSETPSV